MKKILIAIDYNPSAQLVAEAGIELAKLTGAEVCLVHVMAELAHYGMRYPTFMGYEGYDAGAVDVTVMDEMQEVTQNYLDSIVQHLNYDKVTTILQHGNAADAILDYSREWNADLVVMGTHSHSVLEKLFIGSVASRVLEKTQIPLFMVPVKKDQ